VAAEGDSVQTPVAVRVFAKSLSTHLPGRLRQMRAIGRAIAGNTNGKRKR
jgi:hypothetical protein